MKKLAIVVLIDNYYDILELKKLVAELDSLYSWKVIFLNYSLKKKLIEENISCSLIDDYFLEEDHYSDYSQAIEIANSWFRDSSGNDTTVYSGISIGVILQRWMIKFFNDLLSNIKTVKRIFKEENPDELWLCFSEFNKEWESTNNSRVLVEVFSAWARSMNIKCREKKICKKPREKKLRETKTVLFHKSKTLFYSLVVRKMLFFIKYCLAMRGSEGMVNIMLPSPQSLNYAGNTVIDKLLHDKKRNVLIWEGETTQQRINLIDIPPPLFCGVKQNREDVCMSIEKQLSNCTIMTSSKELKIVPGVITQVCKHTLIPIIRGIISDIERLQDYFKKKRVHLVFSHTDTTIKERTVISVANSQKVPSLVLQHGAAGHLWGFFPLIATRFAAWGEITGSWFERNGVSKDRVSITGAANFDSYVEQARKNQKRGKVEWCGMSNYLLYVTVRGTIIPTGFKNTEQDNVHILDIILNTMTTMPEKMLVIKIRPGDPQKQFYESEIKRRNLKNVYVIGKTDNGKLLNACGVLLTTYSTMALEALYFNKPIIQLTFVNKGKLMKKLYEQNILCDEEIIPLRKYGVALGVDRPEKLQEAIGSIYENESIRKSLVERGKIFLEHYCYAGDGNASLRMMNCIEALLGEVLYKGRE